MTIPVELPIVTTRTAGTKIRCPHCDAELLATTAPGPGGDVVEIPCCMCKRAIRVVRG